MNNDVRTDLRNSQFTYNYKLSLATSPVSSTDLRLFSSYDRRTSIDRYNMAPEMRTSDIRHSILSGSDIRRSILSGSDTRHSILSSSDTRPNDTRSIPSRDPARRFSLNDTDRTPINYKNLNNEQVIDLMEREQDGIVLKLIREIKLLKLENQALKLNYDKCSPNHDITKKLKRKLSNEMTKIDENLHLKRENERLKQEIESLNQKLNG